MPRLEEHGMRLDPSFYLRGIFALLIFVWAVEGRAQQAVTSGSISVRVVDASGAVVPGVSITVSNTDLNQNWKSTADEQGRQRFSFLPLGSYELTVEKSGFTTYTAKLVLAVGQSVEIPVTLN